MSKRLTTLGYGTGRGIVRLLLYLLTRWEVTGAEHIPRSGGVLLAANHVHMIDPPVIVAASPRPIRSMAKRELFDLPLAGRLFSMLGAFPAHRFSGDAGALRTSLRVLRHGEALLIFPEGARSHGRGMQPALPGAAMVALMSGVPVVPVAITGSNIRLWRLAFAWALRRRPRTTVRFGEPFRFEARRAEGRAAEEATDQLMRRIAALLPPGEHGVYGEHTTGTVVVFREGRAAPETLPAAPEDLAGRS